MISDEERKQLRSLIEQEIQQLTLEGEELEARTGPVKPDRALGRISRMDAIQDASMHEAALLALETKVKALEGALSKIDDENFGLCTNCGNDILFARLQLVPESNFCVPCAEKLGQD